MISTKAQGMLPASKIRLIAIATAALLTPATQSFAQSTSQDVAAAKPRLEEITVTATRRTTSVQDITYNLSAVTGEQLQELRITDTTSLARWTPGLAIVDQGPRQSNLTIMRGTNVNNVNTSDVNINTNGGTVATFYGETPLYIDPLLVDMQRVEILRGPQGTLFGSRSLGGALRYMPVKPDASEFMTDVHVRGYAIDQSDDLSYQGDITLNAPIIKDVLAFRGTIARLNEAGFIDYTSVIKQPGVSNPEDPADVKRVEDANSEEVNLLRAALLWNITDNIEGTLTYTKQMRDVGGRQVNTKESFGSGEYEAAYRYEEPNKREHDILQLDLNFDFGWATLTSATSLTKFEEKGQRDQTDLNYFEFPPIDLNDIDAWGAFSAYSTETVDTDVFTQELRLVSRAESRLTWLAGFYYQDFDEKTTSAETSPGLADYANGLGYGLSDSDVVYDFKGTNQLKEVAMFGQIGFRFTEKWQATIGTRWFDVDNTLGSCFDFPLYGSNPTCDTFDASGDDAIFMFNTSIDFTEDLMGYFTASEGYGLGGTNPVPVCDDPNGFCITEEEAFVEPEKVVNYEIGMRTAWLNNGLTVNGAVYLMDYDNIHVFGASQSGINITKNAGKAESHGVELELTAALGEFWWTGAGYAYNQSELKQDQEAGTLYPVPVYKGDLLPGSPRNQFSWYLANRYPMQSGLDFLFRYGMNFTDKVFTKIGEGDQCCRDNGEALNRFFVHNASVGLAGEKWEATLFADNLTNENAYTGVRLDQTYIFTDPFSGVKDRRYYKNIITPRSIGVDFRYRW